MCEKLLVAGKVDKVVDVVETVTFEETVSLTIWIWVVDVVERFVKLSAFDVKFVKAKKSSKWID